MTRFGFFLFNILLITVIYGLVYLNGSNPAAISYVLKNFSVPYLIVVIVMILLSSIRWFMSHDSDVAREIVTWVNALWMIPVFTLLALWLIGGLLGPHLLQDLRGLMTAR